MARKFEGSAADNRLDAREAAKRGVSRKAFEGSKADERMDRAGQAALNKGKAARRAPPAPPAPPAAPPPPGGGMGGAGGGMGMFRRGGKVGKRR